MQEGTRVVEQGQYGEIIAVRRDGYIVAFDNGNVLFCYFRQVRRAPEGK